ncbi:hypothetical protein [Streptomyces nymphaeiformis]|uniref:Vacuolar-type H+-ATPase subunit I/STV1 n=1 Tax=Streptomyces nymphaeiformis TaxID=2663842 RepID=A0A7W7XFR0_9ACTN|nr:hypothetical protein [Streptomyces nymphaeiformis]MBB4986705.1 vacuolar-type H+-ATPase subunit I/STV1 [Streptomyces nymphaeiformis]
MPAEVLPRYRRVYRVVKGEQRQFKRNQWWTSRKSIVDQDKHEVMRQRREAERAERAARNQEREEAAKRRRKKLEEQERARKAEEAERLRLEREEEHRAYMEQMRRRWAEEGTLREQERLEREARLAREQAEREEKERQDLATARAWWGRLSSEQISELFAAVAEYARRASGLRVEIPEKPAMCTPYARDVPIYVQGRRRTLLLRRVTLSRPDRFLPRRRERAAPGPQCPGSTRTRRRPSHRSDRAARSGGTRTAHHVLNAH